MSGSNILATRKGRFASFGTLYITEGIPIGFTGTAMAAYMRGEGVGTAEIGAFIAILYLPWAFKWAWAPLVDLLPLKKYGGRRTWIAACQILMIATLMSFAFIDMGNSMPMMIGIALVHNFFASLQDVSIDSLAVSVLDEEEMGRANGFMFGGSYFGTALGGSGALFLSDQFGFMATFPYIAALLGLVFFVVTLRLQDPWCKDVEEDTQSETPILQKMATRLKAFLGELHTGFFKSGKGPKIGVAFAVLPAGALAFDLVTGTTFRVDLGMNQSEIAELAMYTAILSAFGCVAGGWLGDKIGQRKHIAIFYAASAMPVFYIAWLLKGQTGTGDITLAQYYPPALIGSLCIGMYYGVASAVFMGLTNPLVAATQFTGYMALKNLAISYSNYWQGGAIESLGYSTVFFLDGLLVCLPILLLPFMVPRNKTLKTKPMSAPMPEAA
jgi:PAT family beta-lactamase induction signal transducer AmpG